MRGGLVATVALACALSPPAQAQEADGLALFNDYCGACHNEAGIGTPGLAPPLNRPDFWQALGDDAPAFLGAVITRGFNMTITVRGDRYMGMPMMPVAGVEDAELASIANWVLGDLGQLEQRLTAEDIAASREAGLGNDDLKALRPKTE